MTHFLVLVYGLLIFFLWDFIWLLLLMLFLCGCSADDWQGVTGKAFVKWDNWQVDCKWINLAYKIETVVIEFEFVV